MEILEHTCSGMYDLSCEACWEERCLDEMPVGESRWCEYEDEPSDVVGGL